jgi:hypothetical protein
MAMIDALRPGGSHLAECAGHCMRIIEARPKNDALQMGSPRRYLPEVGKTKLNVVMPRAAPRVG